MLVVVSSRVDACRLLRTSRGELLVHSDALDVPGAVLIAKVAARALRGPAGGIFGVEDDHADPDATVGAAQPLPVHETRLPLRPSSDVISKMAGDFLGA